MQLFLAGVFLVASFPCPAFCGEGIESAFDLSGLLSREEYEIIKELEDNPVSPAGKRVEALLILPGFTPEAIQVIKRAAKEYRGDWIDGLPPRVRRLVRRYAIFIKSPRPARRSYNIRLDGRKTGRSAEFSERMYFKIAGPNLLFTGQARAYGKRYPVSGYIMSGLPFGIKVHAGDFLPDFGLGLIASRPVMIYPFSSWYPLKRSRLISRGSYFYGESLRGGVLGFMARGGELVAFKGHRRRYSDLIFKTDPAWTTGVSARFSRGNSFVGLSIVEEEDDDTQYRLLGLDVRSCLFGIETGAEYAFSSRSGSAWACGLRSSDSGKAKCGVVFYGTRDGYSNNFGTIPANGRKPGDNQRGFALVLEERITGGISTKGYVERHCKWKGGEKSSKFLTRLRLIWETEAADCRLEWKRSEHFDRSLLPYPSFKKESSGYRKNTVKLTVKKELGRYTRCRQVLAVPWSERFSGYLSSSSAKISMLDGKLLLNLCAAFHKSLKGRAYFYGYEPSVQGDFPWKYISGSGWRVAFGMRYSMWKAKIHLVLKGDSKGKRSIYLQTIIRFKTLSENWN